MNQGQCNILNSGLLLFFFPFSNMSSHHSPINQSLVIKPREGAGLAGSYLAGIRESSSSTEQLHQFLPFPGKGRFCRATDGNKRQEAAYLHISNQVNIQCFYGKRKCPKDLKGPFKNRLSLPPGSTSHADHHLCSPVTSAVKKKPPSSKANVANKCDTAQSLDVSTEVKCPVFEKMKKRIITHFFNLCSLQSRVTADPKAERGFRV